MIPSKTMKRIQVKVKGLVLSRLVSSLEAAMQDSGAANGETFLTMDHPEDDSPYKVEIGVRLTSSPE